MARALELARRGFLTTRPNPRVGCVLVRDGEVVGEGFTAPAGGPHAEIRALEAAGERARGATAYVSLEPCSHHGRTPPCVDALIAAGVAAGIWPALLGLVSDSVVEIACPAVGVEKACHGFWRVGTA